MNASKSNVYEICVEEHLNQSWTNWFEGLTIHPDFDDKGDPITLIYGTLVDQSALHGILAKVRDLGLVIQFVKLKN